MAYTFEDVTPVHREGILKVFNYYVTTSFGTVQTRPVGPEWFDDFVRTTRKHRFVAVTLEGQVVGFAALRPFHTSEAFAATVKVTYFILPEHTGRGLASQLLGQFVEWSGQHGLRVIMAAVLSLNEGSLAFHRKHGFVECGRFRGIGRKFEQDFDLVWMQLIL